MTTLELVNYKIKIDDHTKEKSFYFILSGYNYIYRLDKNKQGSIRLHGKYWSCINPTDCYYDNFNAKAFLEDKL